MVASQNVLLFFIHRIGIAISPNSKEYGFTAVVLDVARHRLFKSVGIKKDELDTRFFRCRNKGLDDINLGNIIHQKSVKYKIPPYFKSFRTYYLAYINQTYSNINI